MALAVCGALTAGLQWSYAKARDRMDLLGRIRTAFLLKSTRQHHQPTPARPLPACTARLTPAVEEQEGNLPALIERQLMRNFVIATSVILACVTGMAVAQEHKAKAMTPETLQWG